MRELPPLSQLRAFEAAARHLSFKRAADELAVTPTAISHQVRLLERYCGQSLFRRRPRPVTLTEAGARLLPVVREGLDGFAAALTEVRRESGRQPLKVTTTNAFASLWLVPRLPLWRAAHPDITLEVIGTDAALDLQAGDADVAIRYMLAPPPGLVSHELFRDRFAPFCSPKLLRGGRIARPADLARFPLIHCWWSPADPHAPTWRRWLDMARETDPGTPETGAGELHFREELHAIEAVIAGQGITVCSDVLVASEVAAGRLVRAIDLALPGFGFYLAHVADHPRQPAIDAFSSWLRALG